MAYSQFSRNPNATSAVAHVSDLDAIPPGPPANDLTYMGLGGQYHGGADASGLSLSSMASMGLPQTTQLARRPSQRHLAQTSQQITSLHWDDMNKPPSGTGAEDTESIEAMEARAAKIKRDSKSAGGIRKQIPPFVQKLSRYAYHTQQHTKLISN